MKILEKNTSGTVTEAEYDREIAYAIFRLEIDCGIGMVTHDTPAMKLFHLTDEQHIKRYNREQEQQTKGGSKSAQTFK